MVENDKVEFTLEVCAEDITEEELDQTTRLLLSELRQLPEIESAQLARGASAPAGSKGDPVTMGVIALEVLPVAIPSVIAFVQTWVMRKQGRTVKFKGKGIEFEGSPEELQKLLRELEKGKRRSE